MSECVHWPQRYVFLKEDEAAEESGLDEVV